MQIDFFYFTGTGNTLLAVNKMREVFSRNGIQVTMNKIEKSDPGKINLKNTIGLAFPVAGFSTYPFVWDFLKKLPDANGTHVFMVDTMGGTAGGIAGPLKKILKRKGYNTIGAEQIQMPSNIFYVEPGDAIKQKVADGLNKAEVYANNIISGKARWDRVPVLSDIVYYFSLFLLYLMKVRLHQKLFLFKADPSKCSKCGTCATICPVKNIEMKEFPVHGLKCQYCLRCVSFCPKKAIPCGFNYKKQTYTAPGITCKEL